MERATCLPFDPRSSCARPNRLRLVDDANGARQRQSTYGNGILSGDCDFNTNGSVAYGKDGPKPPGKLKRLSWPCARSG